MKHNYYYGLNLIKTDNKDCPQNDEYYFEFEYEKRENYEFVKIKNKATNNYISFDKNNFFALAEEWIDSTQLTLISSVDDFTTIRTKNFQNISNHNQAVYFSNNSNSNEVQQIPGVLKLTESGSFVFIWVSGKDSVETTTKATTKASNADIYYLKNNFQSAMVLVLALIFSFFT
jgi:hypothetical protein